MKIFCQKPYEIKGINDNYKIGLNLIKSKEYKKGLEQIILGYKKAVALTGENQIS